MPKWGALSCSNAAATCAQLLAAHAAGGRLCVSRSCLGGCLSRVSSARAGQRPPRGYIAK
eukprot:3334445-Prymnesium_polylepis.1